MLNVDSISSKKVLKSPQTKKVQNVKQSNFINVCNTNLNYLANNIHFLGFKTNFEREINAQPMVLNGLCDKYLNYDREITMDLGLTKEEAKKLTGVKIIASGSSKNAANCAKNFIEEVSGLPVSVEYSGEFAHKKNVSNKNDLMLFISQSGETADTFSALKNAKEDGYKTLAFTNVPSSKIHQTAHKGLYIGAGIEEAIAATKSVTAQLFNLYVAGLKLAELRDTLPKEQINKYKKELKTIPSGVQKILDSKTDVKKAAQLIQDDKDIFILARGASVGAVNEGALKLRETIYANTTPYDSGEFLHGPIASVDEDTPVIQLVTGAWNSDNYELSKNNLFEILSKRAPKKAFIMSNVDMSILDSRFEGVNWLKIPSTEENFAPLYAIVKFQLLAKELTDLQGKNPDTPRSLTKAVIRE